MSTKYFEAGRLSFKMFSKPYVKMLRVHRNPEAYQIRVAFTQVLNPYFKLAMAKTESTVEELSMINL